LAAERLTCEFKKLQKEILELKSLSLLNLKSLSAVHGCFRWRKKEGVCTKSHTKKN